MVASFENSMKQTDADGKGKNWKETNGEVKPTDCWWRAVGSTIKEDVEKFFKVWKKALLFYQRTL